MDVVAAQVTKPQVIVGFDGSGAALAAVLVAARTAARRGSSLRIVQVVEGKGAAAAGNAAGGVDGELMDGAVDLARAALPLHRIEVETVQGVALDVLLSRSVGADMLVLERRRPGSLRVLLGSVALGATSRAPCSVLVVGPAQLDGALSRDIVVGIDGTDDAETALEQAFTEAHLRRVQLVVIHIRRGFVSAGSGDAGPQIPAVDPFRARFPLVAVTEQLLEGATARTLVDASELAEMLVVGTRGRGPVKSLLLGSVSQYAVAYGRCPVFVARPREPLLPTVRCRLGLRELPAGQRAETSQQPAEADRLIRTGDSTRTGYRSGSGRWTPLWRDAAVP